MTASWQRVVSMSRTLILSQEWCFREAVGQSSPHDHCKGIWPVTVLPQQFPKFTFGDRWNRLYSRSASLRCGSKLFHSPGPAAAKALSPPKVPWVRVTMHVRLSMEHQLRVHDSVVTLQLTFLALLNSVFLHFFIPITEYCLTCRTHSGCWQHEADRVLHIRKRRAASFFWLCKLHARTFWHYSIWQRVLCVRL